MVMMKEYVSLKEAARILGISAYTVRRRIAEGKLPQTRRLAGGFTAPIMIHLGDLRALMRVSRDLDIAGRMMNDKASDEVKLRELNRRCLKLAEALGSPVAINKLIREVGGVDRLSALDPELYSKFRARLIRLANPAAGGKQGANGKFEKRTAPAQIARELCNDVRKAA